MPPAKATMADIRAALGLLTRLPAGNPGAQANYTRAAWAYPVIGGLIGLVAALVGTLATAIGTPGPGVAALVLLTLFLTTGGLHEDGLADTADGLWGSPDRTRALEIMKDSHIGSFGTLALALSVGARLLMILPLVQHDSLWLLPAIAAASRLPMVAALTVMPNARSHGLSHSVGRPSATIALSAGIATLVVVLLFAGLGGIAILLWAGIASAPILAYANHRLGGQTGDILGAAQQCAEIAALAAALTLPS